jgi:hypothetical protein
MALENVPQAIKDLAGPAAASAGTFAAWLAGLSNPAIAAIGLAIGGTAALVKLGRDFFKGRKQKQQLNKWNDAVKQVESQFGPGVTPSGLQGPERFNDKNQGYTFKPYEPNQQQGINSILQQGLQSQQQNPLNFEPIAERARKQFNEQTLPQLKEQYGMGRSTGERSSAFPQLLGRASSDLESNLAALGSQYNLQAQPSIQGLLGLGLTPQTQSLFSPPQQGFGSALAGGAGQAAGMLGTAALYKYAGF